MVLPRLIAITPQMVLVLLLVSGCICEDYLALPESALHGMVGDSIFVTGDEECSSVAILVSITLGERVTSMASSGAQTESITEQYHMLRDTKPDMRVVVADGGVNDITAGQQAGEIYEEIVNMFEIILMDGNDLIYMLPYHFMGEGVVYNSTVDELDEMLLVTCDELGVDCIDLRENFDLHPEYYSDKCHPTVYGRTVIADHFNLSR